MTDQYPPDVVEAMRSFLDRAACSDPCARLPCFCAKELVDLVAALGYRRVPEGHAVVPREATEEQALAAYERDMGPDECLYRSIYRAMVAAANPD